MNLVLYGTLRRGQSNFEMLGLEGRLTFIRQVTFPGLMYDLGGTLAARPLIASGDWLRHRSSI